MSSQFQLSSTSPSATSTPGEDYVDDDEDNLPYPSDLPRNDFLAPDFDPQTYLSGLHNRHQTLEDLRQDLRQRSQLLNKELLDLVNGNYEDFLSLGTHLRGGEEKVEGVRVGLLSFAREVEGIRGSVTERMEEVQGLLREKKGIRRDVMVGRALLEVGESIEELESGLGIKTGAVEDDESAELDFEDDDADEDQTTLAPHINKLQRHAQQYIVIVRTIERIGPDHPFLQAQRNRLDEVKRTLLLDLAAALRQAKADKAQDATLALVKIYTEIGAEGEGVRVLKSGT